MRISIISFLILSTQAAIGLAQSETPVDSVVVERHGRSPGEPDSDYQAARCALDPAPRSILSDRGSRPLASTRPRRTRHRRWLRALTSRPGSRLLSTREAECAASSCPTIAQALSNDVDVAASLRQVGWDVLRGPH